jgi:uncharacterized protein DUF3300
MSPMKSAKGAIATWLLAAISFAPAGLAQQAPSPPLAVAPELTGAAQQAKFKPEELEAIVAPIALYPDALLAQVLMASTYPLEIVEAARWSKANPGLKDQALQDALQKQSWDPSVKALAGFPQALQMMNEKLDMTQKLGDAFLAQPKDVTDAVQRLRAKALAAGNLKSGKELTYTSQKEGDQTIIIIEPTEPEVVYVPTYGPTIYGPWPYPMYPPYYYPPPPGYPAGGFFFGFTVGIIIGGGVWARPVWHTGGVAINVNNYNRINHTNINNPSWQHSPEHRKGAQYRDQASRDKFGQGQRPGVDTREAYRGRAEAGQRDIARGGAENLGGGGPGDRGGGDRGGAFDGVGRGGESRGYSDRGAASRGGSSGGGGFSGGGRGGFGGGGGRGGGRR